MNFSRFLDIQSWWEVPSIAYFCSLFRTAFNLLDFDIEELEEALLTDGTEESGNSLLTELIVRLLNGCLGNNDISAFNYQMYLRRLFRQKCQETGRYNPFNTDIDFQFLPLRTKVEILYALCDFRLDADDVFDLFKNLEAESLRVEPLGWDDNDSAYWYFYGTRLYREDIIKKPKAKNKKRKKESRKRGWFYGDDWLDDDETERVWQVVCFTEEDWTHLTDKFRKASSKVEKELYRSLSQNFLPEIPRLFQEKERLQRKRLLELAPRRTSSRVLQKIKQKEEEEVKSSVYDSKDEDSKETSSAAREKRARRRDLLRTKSSSSDSESSNSEQDEMPQKAAKPTKSTEKRSKNSSSTHKGEPPPEPVVRTGRKTNNSLAAATGQIVIPDTVEPTNSTRKKLKTSQIFSQTEEDIQTDMYKVLEQLTAHEDAWPFMDPVEEEYAPNYYAVIRRPMDLRKMEERLDNGYYSDFSMFKADFKLIVNNCRLYNGQDNEYTTMVDNLQAAFDRLTEKYIHRVSSSDEEIAVEYQIPTPSRKHKLKLSESPVRHKRKKTKSHSDHNEPKSSSSMQENNQENDDEEDDNEGDAKKRKESHKKHDKIKKKRRGHHRHGKHSKNHKKNSHKSNHERKHSKRQKHGKDKDREGKKSKQKKRKSKHHDNDLPDELKRSASQESLESSNRSRSASPLPSIHTPSPSPTELDKSEQNEQLSDPDFLKDKFDKIKERRRHTTKEAWDSLFDFKQKIDSHKQNINVPDKDKNKKLRETIEKLKAKNIKYKDSAIYNNPFTGGSAEKPVKSAKESDKEDEDFSDNDTTETESIKTKPGTRRSKRSCAKSVSASKALEQAVKDISKWLDDAPKGSALSSPCDSPAQTISTEEHDNSRLDDEFSQNEKPMHMRRDGRKRPSSREPKIIKRREIQRTIDRLQPGKSKGNLLTNISNKGNEKFEEVASSPSTSTKTRDSFKEESSPKLSLGSVLPTVEFTLGNDHNFGNEDAKSEAENEDTKTTEIDKESKDVEEKPTEKKEVEVQAAAPAKKDAEVETEPQIIMKPSQEKATPNLSAWFKAFGAPKTTTTTTTAKKKTEKEREPEEKPAENTNIDAVAKIASPKNTAAKYDSPNDPNSPLPDSDDSPHLSVAVTPRQRRTSTGSSISERSSFSQDLDSPRHQMSHNSPLLRSPASPRTDDFQKITYPIINGTVRAGFYQDTTSLKSSPDKSCSPREAPQSPYSPYSQHVYATNSATGSATPNYFVDHNKSPLPTYGQNAPPYYDTSKAPVANKLVRVHDDYTSLGPNSNPSLSSPISSPNHGPYSPIPSPYPNSQTNYSQPQISPRPNTPSVQQPNTTQISPEPKTSLFPVKKRTYEPEQPDSSKNLHDKDDLATGKVRNEYPKTTQALHSSQTMSSTSVDDIALALSEKSELGKLNNTREKASNDFNERQHRDRELYNNSEPVINDKRDSHTTKSAVKKNNIDMINMGYMEESRRHNIERTEVDYSNREHKTNANPQQKGYEIEAIAINLGIHNQQMSMSKPLNKPAVCLNNTTPAHSHERAPVDVTINHNIAHAHQNQYESLASQQISTFSLNDIELANKKLYSCNTTSSPAIDYGNWKMTNQTRKPETLPSDYSSAYSGINDEKLRSDSITNQAALNYNKSIQQQYSNYNSIPRTNTSRTQDPQHNLSAELRIPNPRSLLKNDVSTMSEAETIAKNMESLSKSQKSDKLVQNHPLVSSSLPYKTPYTSHSSIPIESLRNLSGIPQMLERFTNDERYLSSFAAGSSSLYHDKTFSMAQMFNKGIAATDAHATSTSAGTYSQAPIATSKDNNAYKSPSTASNAPLDQKKNRRKKPSETKQAQVIGTQYLNTVSNNDVLTSVKANMMQSSPFNFGTTSNMALSGMYGDNGGFTIDDFRNSTNQLMAANYMAAAVAHQRNSEANAEKLAKPAHQNSNHAAAGTFPFLGHSQVRAGYPFVGTETSSPLYQQYLRYQEELQRQTGAQIMSLYPQAYAPASLGVRQPYDALNRHSWL
ncbi:myb-like protein X [Aricia agestis]|uniref:myb-like protein X n=1 Tax=Aricia agestis TaxID=91739 RepID=UPI001C20AA2A|nr:myb-like protein X [Aricia agestis]